MSGTENIPNNNADERNGLLNATESATAVENERLPNPISIEWLHRETSIRFERPTHVIQATFNLIKDVIFYEHREKQWCFTRLLGDLRGRLLYGKHKPNIGDFHRGYALIKDWYPTLMKERKYEDTWNNCVAHIDFIGMESGNSDFTEGESDFRKRTGRSNDQPQMAEDTMEGCLPAMAEDHVEGNLQAMNALLCEESTTVGSGPIVTLLLFVMRVVWIIVILTTVMVYEASIMGVLMQCFFELNIGNKCVAQLLKNPFLLPFPIWVIMYALFGSEMAQLAEDSMQSPPFQVSRANFLVALSMCSKNSILKGKLDRRAIIFVDVMFFYLPVLMIFVCIAWFRFSPMSDTQGYLDAVLHGGHCGGLYWAVLCVLAFVFSRFFPYLFNRCADESDKPEEGDGDVGVVFQPVRSVTVIARCLDNYNIWPGQATAFSVALQRNLEIVRHEDFVWTTKQVPNWLDKCKKDCKKDHDWKDFLNKLAVHDSALRMSNDGNARWWFFLSSFVWVVTLTVLWLFGCHPSGMLKCAVLIFTNIAVGVTVYGFSKATRAQFPQLDTRFFRSHNVAFVFMTVVMSGLTHYSDADSIGEVKPFMSVTETDSMGVFYNNGSNSNATPYPVCGMQWGTGNASVGILDLAALSMYSYEDDQDNFSALLNASFGSLAEVVHFDPAKQIPRIVAARIGPGTIVVAVKGTSSTKDVLTDLGIYSTVGMLTILNVVVPLFGTVPQSILAGIIEFTRLPFMRQTERKMFKKIENTANILKNKYPNDVLVLTGHSLGGGFAEVAGARLIQPAVGFSAPGNFYMNQAFEVRHREALYQNIVSVQPMLDAVPHVDKHVDLVQRIICRDADGKPRNPWDCHLMANTGCELWRVCGDNKRRDFSGFCLNNATGKKVNANCRGQNFEDNKTAPCPIG